MLLTVRYRWFFTLNAWLTQDIWISDHVFDHICSLPFARNLKSMVANLAVVDEIVHMINMWHHLFDLEVCRSSFHYGNIECISPTLMVCVCVCFSLHNRIWWLPRKGSYLMLEYGNFDWMWYLLWVKRVCLVPLCGAQMLFTGCVFSSYIHSRPFRVCLLPDVNEFELVFYIRCNVGNRKPI